LLFCLLTVFRVAVIPPHHLHPILVNFTASLVPVSLACDLLGRFFKRESLLSTGYWTAFFAAIATPLTAMAGMLWRVQVVELVPHAPLHTHMILGLSLVGLILLLAIWRWLFFSRKQTPTLLYLTFAAIIVAGLMIQGNLGGKMAFGP
jgi:uncharacterized membrane protein